MRITAAGPGTVLRQRDGVTCGPSVAVVAGTLLDPGYGAGRSGAAADHAWFSEEQRRMHLFMNLVWPRAFGTTPRGMARALTRLSRGPEARYRWRSSRGRRDRLADVRHAVDSNRPVPMLIGRWIPRHWVLIIDMAGDELRCYEPTSGQVCTVGVDDVRRAQLSGLGYPRAFAFVVPTTAAR